MKIFRTIFNPMKINNKNKIKINKLDKHMPIENFK